MITNFKENPKKNMFEKTKSPNNLEEVITSNDKFMNKVKKWASFYRKYPFIFCKDYLGLKLKLFQKILLYLMFNFNFFMFIASRGLGKSWLTSVFCICKAILYSKCQIVVASGNLKQGTQIIKYIDSMRKECECLDRSISYLNDKPNTAKVEFWNGSTITVVASNAGARSGRANVLIVDEFIIVDKDTINTVLRKFKANPRSPGYLSNPRYSHLAERNQEIYLSSAGAKWHWSYTKFKSFFNSMMNGKKYFLCDLPYQLTIKDGLRMREEVLDEMSEDDFDPISWSVEMEGIWLGENEKSYFKFDDLEPNRVINYPIYPKMMYEKIKSPNFKYPEKKDGELRILASDISVMPGRNNDSSVFTIMRLIPLNNKNEKYYSREIVYMETMSGGHSTIQAIKIRQMFDDFDCDYIILDCAGVGMGIYDALVQNIYDKERYTEYEAFTSMNDEEMANRCQISDAKKKIYTMKAYAQTNSECAISFRDNLRKGKIKLLVNENMCKDILNGLKGFDSLTGEEQAKFIHPYLQISALISEMVNLEAEINTQTSQVKLKEQSGQRKDRWSSASYGNYLANILEKELKKQYEQDTDREYVFV
ncbi:terminase large subunit domain-containing protein [Clostridium botulinum]|uniref:terminase large subunit domain-containing protein n=1 Tax=Clostridium botulinum TaxID=1491 RepID=UPI001C9B50A8|nr:terminase family protein [Clostridium botulinum]MBY6838829.1 hypothetical protein [Clostridium botulinum]